MADILQVIGALSTVVAILVISFLLSIWKPSTHVPTLHNKHVLITGGSSGIGLEIAKEAIAQGSYVTLIARNISKLKEAAHQILQELQCDKNRINIKVADVTDYGAISVAINESFQWMPVDVLICNAGVGSAGYLEQMSVEWIDSIVGTNIRGTLYTLKVALPIRKERSFKHPSALVLVGSIASMYPLYGGAVYTATKYALKGIAENLRLELFPYNIGVSFACPRFVETPLLSEMEDSVTDPGLAEVAQKVTFYDRSKAENPRDVARVILGAVTQGKSCVASGQGGKMLSLLSAGILPADSFANAVIDMFALVPMRIMGYIMIGYVYAVIWINHRTRTIPVKPDVETISVKSAAENFLDKPAAETFLVKPAADKLSCK
ncbi:hypothetical protein SUGI_0097260 [Cryptomeria japonica]|uniref:3-dehydrosphinganine reductase TSC10A n=1 Tax=Cryptomeria japonica TaxID=3369 RepID=UPI002408DEB4|nr:3-dehydrosphinganine reductase TSC10A [Cryptomeria japonica]GLJ08861.1 hypothetical protein SUGI_0097260 [Cryptomeria japonica]